VSTHRCKLVERRAADRSRRAERGKLITHGTWNHDFVEPMRPVAGEAAIPKALQRLCRPSSNCCTRGITATLRKTRHEKISRAVTIRIDARMIRDES
jgi:hypothetical protein